MQLHDLNNITDLVPVTEPNQVTEPTIKNYGGNLDPFMEVHKEQLTFPDGSINPMVYGVRLGTQDKLLAGNVSANYLLVPNRELMDVAMEIMAVSGLKWEHEKRFFNNKGQFRDIYFCKDGGLEKPVPNVGDLVGLVLEVQNSYNGSTGAGIRIYFQRYICKNGMTSNKYGFGYMFSHNKGQSLNWKDEIFQATNMLRNSSEYHLTNFVEACGKLQKPVDNTEIKLIREKYIPKGTGGNQLPIQQFGQLMDKYYEDGDFTAWGLLNAGTSVLWHPEKLTNANFSNNSVVVDGLLQYGKDTEETTFVDPNQTDIFQS